MIQRTDLIEVLELFFDGNLDVVDDLTIIYQPLRDWYPDNSLRGLIDSSDLRECLSKLSNPHRLALEHIFDGRGFREPSSDLVAAYSLSNSSEDFTEWLNIQANDAVDKLSYLLAAFL